MYFSGVGIDWAWVLNHPANATMAAKISFFILSYFFY